MKADLRTGHLDVRPVPRRVRAPEHPKIAALVRNHPAQEREARTPDAESACVRDGRRVCPDSEAPHEISAALYPTAARRRNIGRHRCAPSSAALHVPECLMRYNAASAHVYPCVRQKRVHEGRAEVACLRCHGLGWCRIFVAGWRTARGAPQSGPRGVEQQERRAADPAEDPQRRRRADRVGE